MPHTTDASSLPTTLTSDTMEQSTSNDSAASSINHAVKDVEQGADGPDGDTANTENVTEGGCSFKLTAMHYVVFGVVLLVAIVGTVFAYAKSSSKINDQRFNERRSDQNAHLQSVPKIDAPDKDDAAPKVTFIELSSEDFTDLYKHKARMLNREYNNHTEQHVQSFYTSSDAASLNLTDYRIAAFEPPSSESRNFNGRDIAYWRHHKAEFSNVSDYLFYQTFCFLFNDITSSFGAIESSQVVEFMKSYSDIPYVSIKANLLNQIHNIFTFKSPIYTPKHQLYYSLTNFVYDGFLHNVVMTYVSAASDSNTHIRPSVTATDLIPVNLKLSQLQSDRLDGDIITFVKKMIVEVALAMHYANETFESAQFGLGLWFVGLNFSHATGMANCSHVKKALPAFTCEGEISFESLIKEFRKDSANSYF